MNNIILDVYYGSQLAQSISDASSSSIFNQETFFIFLAIVIVIFIASIFVFLLIPKINRTPKKYYDRYLAVRKELERIDELYASRKLSFQNYAYTQFHYAKEYEHIIDYLSKFPEYKVKLKNYKLNTVKLRETEIETAPQKKENKEIEIIKYFIKVLTPVADYYRKDEIRQALLDERYSVEIADGVMKGLEKVGAEFNTKEITDNRKAIDLVDGLLENKINKKQEQIKQKEQVTPIKPEKPKSYTMPEIMDNSKYLSKKVAPDNNQIIKSETIEKSKNSSRSVITDKSKSNYKSVIIDKPIALPKPAIVDKPKALPKPAVIEKPKDIPKPVIVEKPKIEPQKTVFESTTNSKTIAESTTIELKDLIKNESKKPIFEELTTFSKYSEGDQSTNQKGVLSSIKSIFKTKDNSHSVSEINDIFKNIDKKLK